MNVFSKLFGSGTSNREPKEIFPWKPLESLSQLDAAIRESKSQPVVLFKHSTRCGISRMVLQQFEAGNQQTEGIGFYYLDLLAHRDISDAIATKFQVLHQSPQVLVLKNGTCVAAASHHDILEVSLDS